MHESFWEIWLEQESVTHGQTDGRLDTRREEQYMSPAVS